jgi:hypothetical protein
MKKKDLRIGKTEQISVATVSEQTAKYLIQIRAS